MKSKFLPPRYAHVFASVDPKWKKFMVASHEGNSQWFNTRKEAEKRAAEILSGKAQS